MQIPNQLRRNPVRPNMTPMIDVVFLLIIFFLVSSHLARQENYLPLPLPTALSGEDDLHRTRPRLTVNVLADGQWRLGGQSVNLEELVSRFQRGRDEQTSALESPSSNTVEVRIRADRNVAYERISPILAAAAEAGIPDVSFAVIEGEP